MSFLRRRDDVTLSALEAPFNRMVSGPHCIALIGLMGVGKTSIGRALAARLGRSFVDADAAIVEAAGHDVDAIFRLYGEAAFRDLEERVMIRLLDEDHGVIATGGGAFMNPRIRAAIRDRGLSVWLRADLATLLERTARRPTRPLLQRGDPEEILKTLMEQRDPVYAAADIVIDTGRGGITETVAHIIAALEEHRALAEHRSDTP